MPVTATERSPFASKHCFANLPVVAAGAIERLFPAVVNARNADGTQVERYGSENQLVALVIRTEARRVVSLANLIVVVDRGDNFVPEPHV